VEEIVKEMVSSEPTKTLISGIVEKNIDNSIMETDIENGKNVILFKILAEQVLGLRAHDPADSEVNGHRKSPSAVLGHYRTSTSANNRVTAQVQFKIKGVIKANRTTSI
jgi:hypothetical protein